MCRLAGDPAGAQAFVRDATSGEALITSSAADAGATIFPLIPAYYFRPATLDQMAREFACRVLAHIGLPQPDAYRWKG